MAAEAAPAPAQKLGETRNLTVHFLRLRTRVDADRKRRSGSLYSIDDGRPLMGGEDRSGGAGVGVGAGAAAGAGGAAWDSMRRSMPPQYVDLVTQVHTVMDQIQEKMRQLEYLHKQRMRVGFDDSRETEHEHNIDILTREVSRYFSMAGQKLKAISKTSVRTDGADGNVRKNLQRSLAAKLHEQSMEFRKMQKVYLKKLQERSAGDSLLGGVGPGGASATDIDLGFTEAQQARVARMEREADSSHAEIAKIAKSVEDLATIFKDLATLVIDQGTVLDRIDYNMDCVVEKTKKGVRELEVADKYSKKSTRAVKCIAVLMCIITAMIIILILKWK